MKSIDFTHPGGFPLTQDQLDYLQQGYTECINALTSMGGVGPTVITGMTSSSFGGITTVAEGWFFYNGELIKFNTSSYGALPYGDVVLVNITPTATSLTYNDGSSFGAILNKTASVITGPPTTTTTIFPFSDLQLFQLVFGQNGRETGWSSLAVSTPVPDGGVTGTIYYKKNILSNTLHIRGFLSANNAQNFAASPAALFYDMGSLPAAYAPGNNAYFTGHYFVSGMIKDDLGVGWIKQVTCVLNAGGQFLVNWIRPDIGISGYVIDFNTTIPLD
jgi:hypothetical protein